MEARLLHHHPICLPRSAPLLPTSVGCVAAARTLPREPCRPPPVATGGLAAIAVACFLDRVRRRRRRIRGRVFRGLSPEAEAYLAEALHPELFQTKKVEEWLEPEVLRALSRWRESGDASLVDLELLPGIRVEAPGVISFALLRPSVCASLLAEARHYSEGGFPAELPNSMNREGVILNDIGLRPVFTILLRKYLAGIAARLLGNDSERATHLGEVPLGTENWGGSTLNDHHTFIVRYKPQGDRGLAMHVDECDITFNVGLSGGDSFVGGDLAFCGMFGDPTYRRLHHTYRHEVGRCVVHAGKRRHGVTDVEQGERASLVLWTKSLLFRGTQEYKDKCGDIVAGRKPLPEEMGPPDPICLSLTHDRDYLRWSHLL
ncbi:unnamed protein product [Polarella glacialis]|uniref:Fe2OG dioxygenase domain-containing protein n=1 Tax=Polarella glacialis TaxID=89957 RepID=A0A813DFZ0_POLGL|nr:unnamed protein product [Polarella glacialis]